MSTYQRKERKMYNVASNVGTTKRPKYKPIGNHFNVYTGNGSTLVTWGFRALVLVALALAIVLPLTQRQTQTTTSVLEHIEDLQYVIFFEYNGTNATIARRDMHQYVTSSGHWSQSGSNTKMVAHRNQMIESELPDTAPYMVDAIVSASGFYQQGQRLSLYHLMDVNMDIVDAQVGNVLTHDGVQWTAANISFPDAVEPTVGIETDLAAESRSVPVYTAIAGGVAQLGNSSVVISPDGDILLPNTSRVDGRDVSADGAALDAHVTQTGNVHGLTLADLGFITNLAGVAPPGPSDDIIDGYTVGSLWVTQGTHGYYVCVDNTEGAAQWKRLDFHEGVITSFHIQDTTITEDDMTAAYHKRAPSGVAALDPFGKIYTDQLPDITIADVHVVPDIDSRNIILNPQEGHIVVVEVVPPANSSVSYIYDGSGWVQLQASGDVTLVNGKNGNVQLATEDVPESPSALYYTDARVSANTDVAANTAHSATMSGNPHSVTAQQIGLGDVPNIKQNLNALAAPTVDDDVSQGYSVGSEWIVPSMDCIFQCTSNALGAAVWVRLDLPDGSVTAAKLATSAVQETHIHHDAVTEDKIADGSVTGAKIAPGGVTSAKIAESAVQTNNLADDSVVATKLAPLAVSTASLQDASVTQNKIADSAIDTSKLSNDAVTESKLVTGAVTSGKIADGTITAVDMAAEYQKSAPLGVAALDSSGYVYAAQLPPISVVSIQVVANITERDAISVQEGDFAIVQDADGLGHSATFAYASTGWVELEFNAEVKSVNGKVEYVMLSTDDIPEGTDQYFTQARVSANSDVAANTAHRGISSGNPHSVTKTDVGLANVQNTLTMVHASLDPASIDDQNAGYSKLSTWINMATGGIFMCVDDSAGAAVWREIDMADLIVTAGKIAPNAVRSSHILDGEVGAADVDSNEVQERITGTCAMDKHIVSIDISGNVQCSDAIGANTVGANQIIDGSVYTSELGDDAVTGPKIADDAVNSAHIVDGTIAAVDVDSTEIQKRIVGACVAAGSHMSTITESGGVTCDTSVASNSVGSAQVQDGSLLEADYGDASVSLAKLQTGSVNSAKIVDDSIAEVDMSAAYKKRTANGVASLDGTGKLYVDQMPAMGTSVYAVADYAARDALTGIVSGDTCIVTGTSETFIWDGASWILVPSSSISDTDELPEGSTNLYYTEGRVSANTDVVSNTAHSGLTSGNPHGITKAMIGLGFVHNIKNWLDTSDPSTNDDAGDDFVVGSYWINSATAGAFICSDNTLGAAQWKRIDLYPAAVGTLELQAGSVTSVKIASGAVGVSQIDTTVVQRRVSGSCSSGGKISDISVDGSVTCDSSVAVNAVGSSQIADGSVSSDDIANGAITAAKIVSNAVDSSKVVDGSLGKVDVDSTEVQERVVGTCPLGKHITAVSQGGGVTCDGSVDADEVGSAQIVDGSIVAADLASGAIVLGKAAAASIQNSNLVDDTIEESKMSAAYKRGVANGIPTLNAFGTVPSSQLPSLAISSTHVVADISARDALTVQEGDLAKVTSDGQTYVWDGAAWIQISVDSAIDTVNGYTGTVVLDSDDVAEGSSNKYYTEGRVSANSAVVANTAHGSVSSGNPHGVTKADVGLGLLENFKHNHVATTAPSATDDANVGYSQGSLWLDTVANKYYACVDATASAAVWMDLSVGDTTDHGAFTGLADDDHTQYALLGGRTGGQTLVGGTAVDDHLVLQSTVNANRGFVKTADPTIINDAGYGNAYDYSLSVQGSTADTWLEILNNHGADKGVFFGVNDNKFELWNYDAGPIHFYTHPTATGGTLRFIIENDGSIRITQFTSAGIVKTSATGVLSVESEQTAYNKAFGTSAGSVAEGNHGHTHSQISDFSSGVDARITLQKGANNGIATLGPSGKIPASQLDIDGLDYQQQWNAATNTPTIVSGVGTKGHFYIVSTAGTTLIDGISDWQVNDWVIFNGAVWEKADHTDRVNSVCGLIGDVALTVSCLTDAGTASSKDVGSASGDVLEVGAAGVSSSEVLLSDGSSKAISEAKGTAFNKNFGTSSGTVAEGDHAHTDLPLGGFLELSDMSSPSNAGAAKGRLYKKTSDDGLWWKPDAAGIEVDLTDLGPTGEVNTASSVGTGGIAVYKQKTGVNIELKSIAAGSSRVLVSDDTGNNEIDVDVVEGNINHDALSGFVANEHVNHASVSIAAGQGLSGGGTITASRTLSLDVNGLTADASPDGANDFLLSYDVSAGAHKKVLISNLPVSGGEENTASNVGNGAGLYKEKSGVDLVFRSLLSSSTIDFAVGTSASAHVYEFENNVDDEMGVQDGTIVGGVTYASGKVGSNSALFDGVSGTKVNVGALDVPNTAQFSISCWFYVNTFSDARLVSKAYGTSTNQHIFAVNVPSAAGVRFRLTTGSLGTGTELAGSTGLSTATWYHVVVWYDGATYKIYLNGVQDASAAKTGLVPTSGTIYTSIGNHPPGGGGDRVFNGRIDQVVFWDKALTTGEITALYNGGAGMVIDTASSDEISASIASNVALSGYVEIEDVSAPANAADGKGRLYKKTGDDGLFWKPDSGGAEVDLTATGGGGGSFSNGGDTAGADRTLGNNDAYALSLETSGAERLRIESNGEIAMGGAVHTDYRLTIRNPSGKNGFAVHAGEVLGDIAFHISDQDDTFQIMEMEADQGHVTLGKTYAQTLTDNGVVYGLDIQHTGVAKDFNTQSGTYRIGGVDVVMPTGGSTGQVLEKVDGTNYNVQWATPSGGGGGGGDAPIVQARKTTTHAVTSTWTTIAFDATDVETDAATVEHDNTNTERINIKTSGTYEVYYSVDATATVGSFHDISAKVLVNGVTLLAGSESSGAGYGTTSPINSAASRSIIATFAANDYVTLQIQYIVASTTGNTKNDPVFSVRHVQAVGPTGPTGPAGSSNLPHGDNVHASSYLTTSSTSHVLATGMSITPPAGTYLVTWSASMAHAASGGIAYARIYAGGAAQCSEMRFERGGNNNPITSSIVAVCKVVVNGSQAIEGRWRANSGTAEMYGRNMIVMQVAA